jgi:putative ABC transport system ATP-binding protein
MTAQSPDDHKVVEAEEIYKSYRGEVTTDVLKGFSFSVRKGELLSIFGPSGCGKTTVLNLLGGLDLTDSGRLMVCGQELDRLNRKQLTRFRAEKIGFIFQFYNLVPTLNAVENVEAGLEVLGMARAGIAERALDYLERVGMRERARNYPSQLSGGEQQRVAIARALCKEPELVLADEPTGNLDQKTAEGVTSLIRRLIDEIELTCIVVSHNPGIRDISDRVISIQDGKAVAGQPT